jgi:sialidase-1
VPAFTSGHGGYHTYRIPSLVKLINGDLLLFAEGRKLSGSDHGWNDIVMKRSSDSGQHWSDQVKVYGESNANKSVCIGNPAPIGRRDGTVGAAKNAFLFCALENGHFLY